MEQTTINVFEPSLGIDEVTAIQRVFENNWPGKGSEVDSFEQEFAKYIGVSRNNVVTTNSCTEACFQILEFIDSDKNEVIIPTNSFIGIANAIVSTGRKIIFCDVDPKTGNISLEDLRKKVTSKTVAVILQHFGGIPAEILKICDEMKNLGVIVIEDAAGALGSKTSNQHCGTFGDYGIWSFDAMKMVVAGDGGMIYAKDVSNINKLKSRMYMGLDTNSGFKNSKNTKRWWEFQISYHGRRSIMNDISASIARTQLAKLDMNIETRTRNYKQYREELSNLNTCYSFIEIQEKMSVNHYFFPIFVHHGLRDDLAKYLQENNIYTTFRYFPLDRIKYFESQNETFPNSDNFTESLLLLPQHGNLTSRDISRTVKSINEFFPKK